MSEVFILNAAVFSTLVFWGIWGVFDKLALKHGPPVLVLIAINSLAPLMPLFLLFFIYRLDAIASLSAEVFGWTFLAGLSYFVSMLLYLWVLNKTEASLILGLTSSYPIVLQFFSHLFLGEPLVPMRIAGSILVALGIVVMGLSSRRLEKAGADNDLSLPVWLAIIAATVLWGIWGVFDKKAIELSGAIEVFFCKVVWDNFFELALIAFVVFTVRTKSERARAFIIGNFGTLFNASSGNLDRESFFAPLKKRGLWAPALVSAFCLYVGGITYLFALSKATASYVVVITGCYPLVMYIFALLILKEAFSRVRLLGILLITGGGTLAQLTQGL
ncbi:MAG TPA: EamA family transporter [Candidatus Melainabacteria bacterium]|nr:EamA family transporter [Candidatus Melainabacteria bacterium]